MPTRATSVFVLLITLTAAASFAQDKPNPSSVPPQEKAQVPKQGLTPDLFSISMAPGVSIPVSTDSAYFDMGGGADIDVELRMPFYTAWYLGANVGYYYAPVRRITSLSTIEGGVLTGLSYEPFRNFMVKAFTGGGYFYGLLNNGAGTGSNPYLAGGVGVSYFITPNLSLGVQGSYRYFFGLMNDIAIAAGTTYRFGAPGSSRSYVPGGKPTPLNGTVTSGMDAASLTLSDVYPVFYAYYDDHPIGKAVLHNAERVAAENISISVYVKEFMDNPKITSIPGRLDPGADLNIDLFGLFNSGILSVSEPKKVSAAITIDYTMNGQPQERQHVETLRVLDRNALTWDDDRKAGAFVSAKDPTVMLFAKNIQSIVRSEGESALDQSLLLGMAIHDSLTLYGLTYSLDPIPTFTSTNAVADYIQFPLQTLQYKAGKCSDFSVLYASMFEALGFETAFITVPGHIYVALALQMSPEDAKSFFEDHDDLIYSNGKAWIPIEITLREGGFMKAWQLGAKEWRDNQATHTARFYPIRDSWNVYPAVGYSGTAASIKLPSDASIVAAYQKDVKSFVDSQLGEREATLKTEIERAGNKAKARNSLAILYGRFGMYEKSEELLRQVLAADEYVPALVNLGNIYFVKGDMDNALAYYQRAYKKAPTSSAVLLGVARASNAKEDYQTARRAYSDLEAADPFLAEKFAYLEQRAEGATRAADAAHMTGVVPASAASRGLATWPA